VGYALLLRFFNGGIIVSPAVEFSYGGQYPDMKVRF